MRLTFLDGGTDQNETHSFIPARQDTPIKSARHDPVQRERLLAVLNREKHRDRIRKSGKLSRAIPDAQGPSIRKDITMGKARKQKLHRTLAAHARIAQEEMDKDARTKMRNEVLADLKKEGKIKIGVGGKVIYLG